jgi:hypothetical protein
VVPSVAPVRLQIETNSRSILRAARGRERGQETEQMMVRKAKETGGMISLALREGWIQTSRQQEESSRDDLCNIAKLEPRHDHRKPRTGSCPQLLDL